MIKFSDVINRIRETCPTFGGRVGASVAFQAALSSSADLPVPHCFVMPVEFKDFSLIEYDESYPDSLKVKVIREVFSTVICLDNSDSRGAKDGGTKSIIPLDLLGEIQSELEACFMGWKPSNIPSTAGEINLSGGDYGDSDNKRLWYSFEWAILYRRGNGGLTAEQQQEIDDIINENGNTPYSITTIKVRNNLSDDTLQPVANPDLMERNEIPDGPPNAGNMTHALGHLDTEETHPIGQTNPTDQQVADAASSEFSPEPAPDGKGAFTDEVV